MNYLKLWAKLYIGAFVLAIIIWIIYSIAAMGPTYMITFLTNDGETYATYLEDGGSSYSVPPYNDQLEIEPNTECGYRFIGWRNQDTGEMLTSVECESDATYVPVYEEDWNVYEVTFVSLDEDGEVDWTETKQYLYNYNLAEDLPARPSDDEYDYEFISWAYVDGTEFQENVEDPSKVFVRGNATYEVIFSYEPKSYTSAVVA